MNPASTTYMMPKAACPTLYSMPGKPTSCPAMAPGPVSR